MFEPLKFYCTTIYGTVGVYLWEQLACPELNKQHTQSYKNINLVNFHFFSVCLYVCMLKVNVYTYVSPIALRTVKALWSFGCSGCIRVKGKQPCHYNVYEILFNGRQYLNERACSPSSLLFLWRVVHILQGLNRARKQKWSQTWQYTCISENIITSFLELLTLTKLSVFKIWF